MFFTIVFGALVLGIFISHRIAGPIIAFRRHIKLFRDQGEMEPLRLRKTDEMQDLLAVFNQILKKEADRTREHLEMMPIYHQKALELHKRSGISDKDRQILEEIIKISS